MLQQYDEALSEAGLCDLQDRCALAAARVKEGEIPGWRRFERCRPATLYDLTEAEFLLVRSLIEALPDGGLVVLFNTTANVKPTQFAEWTWQRFVRDESLAEKTFPEFCRPSTRTARFSSGCLSSNPARPASARMDSLRIVEAPGRYKEVERSAPKSRICSRAGESPSEIAVVVRHIETYGEMIEDVFTAIRHSRHVLKQACLCCGFRSSSIGLSMLDLVTSERSRDRMARVMSSAYFEPRLSPDNRHRAGARGLRIYR